MRRVWIVRHGATSWSGIRYCGRIDLGLNLLGRRQAREVAAWLASRVDPGATIHVSPMRRTVDTAASIAAAIDGRLLLDPRLREASFGAAEGLTFEAFEDGWPELAASLIAGRFPIDWPNGESAAAQVDRVTAAWHEIQAPRGDPMRNPAGGAVVDTLIVTHGGPARLILDRAAGPEAACLAIGPGEVVAMDERDIDGPGPRWRVTERWRPKETNATREEHPTMTTHR